MLRACLLGDTLRAGALPNLVKLNLSSSGLTSDGVVPIADALAQGACTSLSVIELGGCELDGDAARALTIAVRSGYLNNLEYIDIRVNFGIPHSDIDLLCEAVDDVGGWVAYPF